MKHIHEIKDEILCRDDSSDLKRGFHRLPRTSFHGLEIQFYSHSRLGALRLSLYNMSTMAFAVFKALENSTTDNTGCMLLPVLRLKLKEAETDC